MAIELMPILEKLLPVLVGFGGGMINTKYGSDLNVAESRRARDWEEAQRARDRNERAAMFEKQRQENQKDRDAQLARAKMGNVATMLGERYDNPLWNIVAAATRR
jgi:hypothetical protein